MARRSDHSRDELYELALGAARRIIEDGGYRALTARKVADHMGYSPGTLYNVFADLDDLMVHLNGRTLGRLHDGLAGVRQSGDPLADLMALLDCYLSFIEHDRDLWNLLFDHGRGDGEDPPDWYYRKVEALLAIIESALAPLFLPTQGVRRAITARTLWAGLHGICSLAQSGKLGVVTAHSTRHMAQALVSDVVNGCRFAALAPS